jgi:hypothetical protein
VDIAPPAEDWGAEAAAYVPPRRSGRARQPPEHLSAYQLPAERVEADDGARRNTTAGLSRADQAVLATIHAADRQCLHAHLERRKHWHDTQAMLNVSMKAAIRERGEEARSVITAELAQLLDKQAWHGVHLKGLTKHERQSVIRSKMFLKDKLTATGVWERYKARLVAGGDMQDKTLYDNLSSPTASTTHVLSVAAIAACEGRKVMVIDIGGAFLHAKLSSGPHRRCTPSSECAPRSS